MQKIIDSKQMSDNLDATLLSILSDVEKGVVSVKDAQESLSKMICHIDNRDMEAEEWNRKGRKLIRVENYFNV